MINKQDAPYENQEDDSFKLEEFGYILYLHIGIGLYYPLP